VFVVSTEVSKFVGGYGIKKWGTKWKNFYQF
jgi:hypothetical protein